MSVNVNIDTYVDISVDEFLDSCSSRDIDEIIAYINDDKTERETDILPDPNYLDVEWLKKCQQLVKLRLRISMEDEEKINEILNKY